MAMMRKEANEIIIIMMKKRAAHINFNTSIFLSLESLLYTYSHTTLVKSAQNALRRCPFIYVYIIYIFIVHTPSTHRAQHISPNVRCVLAGISLK